MAIRAIVTDIEGTTSSIAFVHDVLFPYARAQLPAFVRAHRNDAAVRTQLDAVADASHQGRDDLDGLLATLDAWMAEDRKATPLKALQGMVWEAGYRSGAYLGHVYPDVPPALRAWHAAGIALYVYSSGSVAAQKLLFGHSEAGDLTPLFSGYFDTRVGAKREAGSYTTIAQATGLPPLEILFLSDVTEELDAASAAGFACTGLCRPPAALPEKSGHRFVHTFNMIRT